MICTLAENDFCVRHKTRHQLRERELSQMDNELGAKYRALWDRHVGLTPVRQPARVDDLSCVNRGAQSKVVGCPSCAGRVEIKVFACAVHGQCHLSTKPLEGIKRCRQCSDRQPTPIDHGPTTWPLRFSERNLFPGMPGRRFNPTLTEWEDGYLMAYRDGWAGSQIHVVRMTKELQPIGRPVRLNLNHPSANYGREDPRFFRFQGRLHLAYVGVEGQRSIRHTNVLYARLSPNGLTVEQIYYPRLPSRNDWEKNHAYFSHADQLYAIYTINPHRILAIDGDKAAWAHETKASLPWAWGEPRGGASPIMVDGEWWHFFHSSKDVRGRKTYAMGVYTFDPQPPFAIKRWTPEPLIVADRTSQPVRDPNYCDCYFPAGVTYADGQFTVSAGEHDRHARIDRLERSEIERKLITV